MENLDVNSKFWQGKKVFLTGHTGFKGSWLSLWLQSMGAEVTGFSLPPATNPSLFEVAKVAEGMHSIEGDIRDQKSLASALTQSRAEIVFHMAAQALVIPSYENPVETYMTNVMGTVHLLEAIRHNPTVKAAVIVTSDKCYDNKEWLWPYRENEAMGGHDPYSNSKGCAELVTAAYRSSFFSSDSTQQASIATVRAGNVIGGGDWSQYRLIPDLLNALAQKQKIQLRNPSSVRPWQHVLEPLCGYMMLAQALHQQTNKSFAEAWNFGPSTDSHHSVEWITTKMAELYWGKNSENLIIEKAPTLGHEAHLLHLDSSKARNRLNWKPHWNLEMALESIVKWHKAFIAKENMKQICIQQIHSYTGAKNL